MRKAFFILFFVLMSHLSLSLRAQSTLDSLPLLSTDSQQILISDYRKAPLVTVIFTSNHCIYSKKYEDRLLDMVRKFQQEGVVFILVNSNSARLSSEDRLETMKIRAAAKNYPCPYARDDNGALARYFGATKNPEVFVGRWTVDGFTVLYSGQIDDNPLMSNRVDRHFLRDALRHLLGDQDTELPAATTAVGCGIKFD
jgi:peroxiredoxin